MKNNMLKYIRILAAVLSLAAMTMLFVDITGFAAARLAWLPAVQFVPSLLCAHFIAVALIVLITLLFGRIYCSVICPLGLMQDAIGRLSRVFSSKQKRRRGARKYVAEHRVMRTVFLVIFVILLILGAVAPFGAWAAGLIEPYSAFGRMMTWLVKPVSLEVANAAGWTDLQFPLSIPLMAVSAVTFIIIAVMSWTSGRAWCNTVCPVGTLLGFVSRYSLFKVRMDADKCVKCGACSRHCKSSCIDFKNRAIDSSRCVDCFNCLGQCKFDAIAYTRKKKVVEPKQDGKEEPVDESRRGFIGAGVVLVAGVAAAEASAKPTRNFAPLKVKEPHEREMPVLPPGAKSLASLSAHCTACQLCITSCPNEIIKPSSDPATFMQPRLDYTKAYCRPECNVCGDVCPNGAIVPIKAEEKALLSRGIAKVDYDSCLSAAYGQHCGLCARRCPYYAISMKPGDDGNVRPVVDESKCVGCGACEYYCPVGTAPAIRSTTSAIYVEGRETQIKLS